MGKATLTFSLPDEDYEFRAASRALELTSALHDIAQKLRQRLKHEEPSEAEVATLDALWGLIPHDIINE